MPMSRSQAFRYLILAFSSLMLASCQHAKSPAAPSSPYKTSALIKKTGQYGWQVQLTVDYPDDKGSRTVWFKTPSGGVLPLEDCTDVSAAATYANGGEWLQPGGPKWHGYLIIYPNDSPPKLEIQCIERASCSCRHFGTSELSGKHPVTRVGVWKPFPKS